MNGCEFLEELANTAFNSPPAAMIAGSLAESVRMRATHAGALAVLSKPFDQREILKMVQGAVHRKQEASH